MHLLASPAPQWPGSWPRSLRTMCARTSSTPCSIPARQEGLPSRDELYAKLAEVRRLGYAFSRNLLYRGASVLAVALPCHSQGRRLALGIAGPTDRVEENMTEYVALLTQHSEGLATHE
ncbi:MAG: hypothetical protein JOZ05_01625 [Acetobacteraceae bacterium]|nr:hypothetical protein [Acetobacteraceae bacterium]